jgi:hypothetical protein
VAGLADEATPEARLHTAWVLCAEFVPDPNRITVCLQNKIRDLSPACQTVMAALLNDKVDHDFHRACSMRASPSSIRFGVSKPPIPKPTRIHD